MLKFNRSKKRLVIPAGINPSYGIDSSTLYNVSDADIDASDVLEGKIGYGKDGKVVGTLNIESEKEESYQEGYEFGYTEGNNAGYQLGYDEGKDDGYTEGFASGEASKQPEIDNLNSIIEANNEDFTNINQRLQNINGE